MTTMRSEIGQLTLDSVLKERQSLNNNISTVINQAAEAWGVQCLRYEIKDVHPPEVCPDVSAFLGFDHITSQILYVT